MKQISNKNGIIPMLIFSVLYTGLTFIMLLEFSFGLIPTGVFLCMGIGLVSVIAGICSFMIELNSKSHIFYKWFFLTFGLTFLSFTCCLFIARHQHNVTLTNAEVVIKKIEEYKSKNDKYPKSLNDLKVDGTTNIPKSRFGIIKRPFRYLSEKENEFELMFYAYAGVEYWYDSKQKDWFVHD